MSDDDSGLFVEDHPGGGLYTIKPRTLIAVSYTAIYDDGSVTVGAATHNGSDEPLAVEFRNARGSSADLMGGE